MGNAPSSSAQEKIVSSEITVCFFRLVSTICSDILQFSPDVVGQLATPRDTPPARQETLDAHIRSRIQAELKQLRDQEESVRQEIHSALEKENLDRQSSAAEDAKSSVILLNDLDELQTRIDKFKSRKDLSELPAVKAAQEAVVLCYK
jgi:MICOS complex subunit MIC19